MPVTRDEARLRAAGAKDPESLRSVLHPELESDPRAGGFAFQNADGVVVIVGYDGSLAASALHDASLTPEAVIAEWLGESRRRNRDLSVSELGPWQRAALEAVRRGTTVGSLSPADRAELTTEADLGYAEALQILVHRLRYEDPLRAFASEDYLLAPPSAGSPMTVHACPICAQPALHTMRYPRSVCDDCLVKTCDRSGRTVKGFNIDFSGGFVAHFVNPGGSTGEVCDEVSRTHRCWIGDRECSIDEAKFGGVVVEAL